MRDPGMKDGAWTLPASVYIYIYIYVTMYSFHLWKIENKKIGQIRNFLSELWSRCIIKLIIVYRESNIKMLKKSHELKKEYP